MHHSRKGNIFFLFLLQPETPQACSNDYAKFFMLSRIKQQIARKAINQVYVKQ